MENRITQTGGYKIEVDGDKITVADMRTGNVLLVHDRGAYIYNNSSEDEDESILDELDYIDWDSVIDELFDEAFTQLENAYESLENACIINEQFEVNHGGIVYQIQPTLEGSDIFLYNQEHYLFSKKLAAFYNLAFILNDIEDLAFYVETDYCDEQILEMRESYVDDRSDNIDFWLNIVNNIPVEIKNAVCEYFDRIDTFYHTLNGLSVDGKIKRNIIDRFLKTAFAYNIKKKFDVNNDQILKQSDWIAEIISEKLHVRLVEHHLIEIEL